MTMKLAFTLTMLNNNSWNGKWSGAERMYVKVIDFGAAKKTRATHEQIIGKSFYYNFGDGWGASVSVREVDGKEARKLSKESAGFCGYDWMVDEIRYNGRIRTLAEREKTA